MNATARTLFLDDTVSTASPARLLTLLYDRLLLDLDRGAMALSAGDPVAAAEQLRHAQDIVAELIATLDVEAWEGGPALMGLYTFVLRELLEVGRSGDPARVLACREIMSPLAEAWHAAAAAPVVVPQQRDAGERIPGE